MTASVSTTSAGCAGSARPAPGPAQRAAARRELPARAGHRWLAGDLHAHTVHSDGAFTVAELARFAAAQGLDFLAVTDHNTTSHHAELKDAAARYGITLIPGQEVTTEDGARERARRRGLDRLPRAARPLAGHHRAARRAALGQSSDRRPRQLDLADAAAAAAGRSLALELAGSALDEHAGLVAGLGSGRRAGGRQRLARAWRGRHPRDPHDLGGMRWRGTGRGAGRAAAGRCTISARRDGPVLLRRDGELVAVGADGTCWPGRTARGRWCGATSPCSRPPTATTACSTSPAPPWP